MTSTYESVTAKWHLLGSKSGYETLASHPELSPEDARELEVLGFGQTDREDYLAKLATEPACLGRQLATGRYAISRCFEGEADTAGRRTLLFATLVFERSAWVQSVSHGLNNLLNDAALWRLVVSQPTTPIAIRCSESVLLAESRTRLLLAADKWLLNSSPDVLIVANDDPQTSRAICDLASVIPPRERARFSFAVRALSASIPVGICTLAECADWGGRRKLIEMRHGAEIVHPFTVGLASVWGIGAPIPRAYCDGWDSVESFLRLTAVDKPHNPTNALLGRSAKMSILVLVLLLAVTAVGFAGWSWKKSPSSRADLVESNPISTSATEIRASILPHLEKRSEELIASYAKRGEWDGDQVRKWSIEAEDCLAKIDANSPWAERIAGVLKYTEQASEWLVEVQKLDEQIRSYQKGLIGAAANYPLSPELLRRKSDFDALVSNLGKDPRADGWLQLRTDAIVSILQRLSEIGDAHISAVIDARHTSGKAARNSLRSLRKSLRESVPQMIEPVAVARTRRDLLIARVPEIQPDAEPWMTSAIIRAAAVDPEVRAAVLVVYGEEWIEGLLRCNKTEYLPDLPSVAAINRDKTSSSRVVNSIEKVPPILISAETDPLIDGIWQGIARFRGAHSTENVERVLTSIEEIRSWWTIALRSESSMNDPRHKRVKDAALEATNDRISQIKQLRKSQKDRPTALSDEKERTRQLIATGINELSTLLSIKEFPTTLKREIEQLQESHAPLKQPEEKKK